MQEVNLSIIYPVKQTSVGAAGMKEHICWLCDKIEKANYDDENYTCQECRKKCGETGLAMKNNKVSDTQLEFMKKVLFTAALKFCDAEGEAYLRNFSPVMSEDPS